MSQKMFSLHISQFICTSYWPYRDMGSFGHLRKFSQNVSSCQGSMYDSIPSRPATLFLAWPFLTVHQRFVVFHARKWVENDVCAATDSQKVNACIGWWWKNCVLKVHSQRQIFCSIMVCYYSTLVRYGTLDKAQVSDQNQRWKWKGYHYSRIDFHEAFLKHSSDYYLI